MLPGSFMSTYLPSVGGQGLCRPNGGGPRLPQEACTTHWVPALPVIYLFIFGHTTLRAES